MQFKKLSAKKLKINLTESDIKLYSLSRTAIAEGGSSAIKALSPILAEAQLQTGVITSDGRLSLSSYEPLFGGLEILIERFSGENGKKNISLELNSREALCALQKRLKEELFDSEPLFYYRKGRYFMTLSGVDAADNSDFFLGEYGDLLDDGIFYYITEHFEPFDPENIP